MSRESRRHVNRHGVSWAWWGFAGGVTGLALILLDQQSGLAEGSFGPEVAELLDRGNYHLTAGIGLVVVLCLTMFATGWRRWATENRRDLAALAVAPATAVTATLVLLGTGIKAALAEYVVGATNAGHFTNEGVYALFVLDDSAAYFAWWGADRCRAGGVAVLQGSHSAGLVRCRDGGRSSPNAGGVWHDRGPQRCRCHRSHLADPRITLPDASRSTGGRAFSSARPGGGLNHNSSQPVSTASCP